MEPQPHSWLRISLRIRTQLSIPFVPSVTIWLVSPSFMGPPPVGVNGDLPIFRKACLRGLLWNFGDLSIAMMRREQLLRVLQRFSFLILKFIINEVGDESNLLVIYADMGNDFWNNTITDPKCIYVLNSLVRRTKTHTTSSEATE